MEREREEEDDRDRHGRAAPGPQHNPAYYLLGFVVLALLVFGMAFLHSKNKETQRKEREAEAAKEKAARDQKDAQMAVLRAAAAEADAQAKAEEEAKAKKERERLAAAAARRPTPPPPGGGIRAASRDGAVVSTGGGTVKYVENPPTGGNYGKTQSEILVMLKKDRSGVLTDLPHLPDTPFDQQGKIDTDVGLISNPNAGGEALQAEERLVKAGRAAIPRVLAIASRLDFSRYKNMMEARDQCVVAASVDRILREITGYTTPPRLQFTPEGRLDEYPVCIDEWYLWWLTTGYKRETFYKAPPEQETEEKL